MSAEDPTARPPIPPSVPVDLAATDLADLGLADEDRLEGLALMGAVGPGLQARAATIAGSRLRGALAGARLHGLHVHEVEAEGADLANVDLRGGALSRVVATHCRLTGAQLVDTSLRDVRFVDCRVEYAVLAQARLDRIVFSGCDLREVSFEQAQLRDVRFERCDLSGAAFGRARLLRVELEGCVLNDVHSVSDLRGAAMPWPDLVAHAGTFAAALGIAVLEARDDPGPPPRAQRTSEPGPGLSQ